MMVPPSNDGYALCASPRSGSTMLCDLLRASGVAGAPASFFRPEVVPKLAADWDVPLGGAAWDQVYVDAARHHGDAGTGRFGMRIMWRDMPGLLARMAELYPWHGDGAELLGSVLGVTSFVHLSRVDKVAEAVSLRSSQPTRWMRSFGSSSTWAVPPRFRQ